MNIIYLIRHGQASFGAADYDALSEIGERQSAILGEYFRDSGIVFNALFTGTLKRQTDTARIAAENSPDSFKGLNPVAMPEFDEHESGAIIKAQLPSIIEDEPEMAEHVKDFFKNKHSFNKLFTRAMSRWFSGDYNAPGIEPYAVFKARILGGLDRIATDCGEDAKIAVFTSGGVIAPIVQSALDVPNDRAVRLPWWTRNASVTVVRRKEDRLDLLSFNSAAHIEMKNDPSLLTYK